MLEVAFTYSLSLKNVLLNSCAVVRVRQPTQTAVASEYDSPTTTYLSVFHEGGDSQTLFVWPLVFWGYCNVACCFLRVLVLLIPQCHAVLRGDCL